MKKSGILLPIFSLPNEYGIGSFGREAYEFIDFLSGHGQQYWQVLPLNPTSYGDSPYQSPSAYAGNPYFISLEKLLDLKLLTKEDCDAQKTKNTFIDYKILYETRFETLKKAYKRFKIDVPDEYYIFCKDNDGWLRPYSLFMTIKERYKGLSWTEWKEEKIYLNVEGNYDELNFWSFIQFQFYSQWFSLMRYAAEKGIGIIGDMPIYVAMDSADVWSNTKYFQLDEKLLPECVAGVPPDMFSDDGQLWGNPLYNWEAMEKDDFSWWVNRVEFALKMYDTVRIDHFRGFAAYYSIPFGETTAKNGEWVKAPGRLLFDKISDKLKNARIIAEDLGLLDDDVRSLLKHTDYPGMKIAQFGYDEPNSEYLPSVYPAKCIAYTGTHDNMTAHEWIKTLKGSKRKYFISTLNKKRTENLTAAFVRNVLESNAELTIIPIQDYMNIGAEGRINIPSTLGDNWVWRMPDDYQKKCKNIDKLKK